MRLTHLRLPAISAIIIIIIIITESLSSLTHDSAGNIIPIISFLIHSTYLSFINYMYNESI